MELRSKPYKVSRIFLYYSEPVIYLCFYVCFVLYAALLSEIKIFIIFHRKKSIATKLIALTKVNHRYTYTYLSLAHDPGIVGASLDHHI